MDVADHLNPGAASEELSKAAKARLESKNLIAQSRELRKQSEQLIEAMLKQAANARRDPN